jgi:hypothetical protein
LQAGKLKRKFNAVVISGDFTWKTCEHGFKAARKLIPRLIERGLVRREGIVLVPGNHDMSWGFCDATGAYHYTERGAAEDGYTQMRADVFRGRKSRQRFNVGPLGLNLGMMANYGDGTIIAGLNSCRIETPKTPAVGFVGFDQLCGMEEHLCKPCGDGVRIAVLHHAMIPEEDKDGKKPIDMLGLTAENRSVSDATELHQALEAYGFSIVLHGHTHMAYQHRGPGMRVHCVGSLAVRPPDCNGFHHFQVLEIQSAQVTGDKQVTIHDFWRKVEKRARREWAYREWVYDKSPRVSLSTTERYFRQEGRDERQVKARNAEWAVQAFDDHYLLQALLRLDGEAEVALYKSFQRLWNPQDGDPDAFFREVLLRLREPGAESRFDVSGLTLIQYVLREALRQALPAPSRSAN